MKDMSEEKEYHKHKFVVKDGDKAFPIMMCEECEFELDKEYYDGYVVPLERELKEWKVKCAFLESRLKEAEKKRCQCGEKYRCPIHECQDALYRQIHHLEEELKAWRDDQSACMAERCGDEVHCTCVPSLRRRVKELEQENKILTKQVCENGQGVIESQERKIIDLEARLSHLMDVAEKLVVQIDGEGGHGYAVHGLCDKLKAEWDGIK